jgi:hypothetical protein
MLHFGTYHTTCYYLTVNGTFVNDIILSDLAILIKFTAYMSPVSVNIIHASFLMRFFLEQPAGALPFH